MFLTRSWTKHAYFSRIRRLVGSKPLLDALNDLALLRAVSKHKSVFFARKWAKFEEAVPGTLRLVPPQSRRAELEQDYARMREEMICGEAPTLEHLLEVLADIERLVNAKTA